MYFNVNTLCSLTWLLSRQLLTLHVVRVCFIILFKFCLQPQSFVYTFSCMINFSQSFNMKWLSRNTNAKLLMFTCDGNRGDLQQLYSTLFRVQSSDLDRK